MYEKLTNLNQTSIDGLKNLMSQVEMKNKPIRLGKNGIANLSVYDYSKWNTWNKEHRNQFKTYFDSVILDTSLIGWFLKFPANVGFLDEMIAWKNTKMAGVIIAYSLEENQSIWIENQEIFLEKGQGIKFSLRNTHEVKNKNFDQHWACLMLPG